MSTYHRMGYRAKNEPAPVTSLWAFIGGVLALAAAGYVFAYLWMSLPAVRWGR
jgi:hypothetical protein